MIGRALLGVAIGGFWSMSTAIVMRLLPRDAVPKGLAMLNAGNAIAATISAPLGSYLGGIIGWRGAFFFVVPLALLALVWQWIAMPSLPPRGRPGRGNVFRLLGRAQVALGMTAILLLFMGQFALFTYLRPFLETVTGLTVAELSLAFLAVGLAGVAGTWCISRLLGRRLYALLIGIPAVMAAIAVLLIVFGHSQHAVVGLLVLWGFFGTAAPVGWGTWLARVMHDEAEAGGGLQVAVIQFAIMIGAAGGGLMFDARRLVERLRRGRGAPARLVAGRVRRLEELGESEMTPNPLTLSRRTVLAGAAASLALPRFARAQQTGAAMRLRCRFADQDFTYRLLDNATVAGPGRRSCRWI